MKTTRSCLSILIICLASIPAHAQVNLSGVWNNLALMHEDWPDRWPGPEVGDYAGVPLNDAARLRADTWDASLITLPEYHRRRGSAVSAPVVRPEHAFQETVRCLGLGSHALRGSLKLVSW